MTQDRQRLSILTTPLFLSSLLILILNDHVFKAFFPCWLTGKVSDFAGLFAFAITLYAILPKHKRTSLFLGALAFIWWKSPLSSTIIDWWNSMIPLTINRTVDYTDLFALPMLPLAYWISSKPLWHIRLKIPAIIPLLIAFIAFSATSYTDEHDYEASYEFDCPKTELLKALNDRRKKLDPMAIPLSFHVENANDIFPNYLTGSSEKGPEQDTLWYHKSYVAFEEFPADENDDYATYYEWVRDTIYIDQNGYFILQIPAKAYMQESNTSYCDFIPGKVRIEGGENSSRLSLIKVAIHNCMGIFEREAKKNEKENLKTAFEIEFVEQMTRCK